jgi:energy-coupling factor transporter ATP-binding protein EcfA2
LRFSRLRLNGFKSFVDPTDLVIADGLTGVVGPNGCGKSNLLEALRWVMGENRPSAMRGGGMEDVIFAGASTRPARNFAEVGLIIDNSERLAPAGFNENDGLEIIRRITRDAGSAYKVNTKDVRARDVQMLFADASTGAHSPALVRQGQISELINAQPKARRRILEEAAGISGLYQRRHEAELKLKGAETNLTRVDDVIEQLANQLASLGRQARQAKRYREIGGQLRHAEGLLLYLKWREASAPRPKRLCRSCAKKKLSPLHFFNAFRSRLLSLTKTRPAPSVPSKCFRRGLRNSLPTPTAKRPSTPMQEKLSRGSLQKQPRLTAKAKASTTPWTQPPRKPTKPPASFITAKTIYPL